MIYLHTRSYFHASVVMWHWLTYCVIFFRCFSSSIPKCGKRLHTFCSSYFHMLINSNVMIMPSALVCHNNMKGFRMLKK